MDRPYLKIAESANSFFQSLVLSAIFVFNSNISQIRSIFEKILAPILFPLVVIPDAIASLFALYRFTRAKNKNLGLTFDLIHVPIKTALVFTAVFAGLSLIYVQSLFFAAVGSSALYHASLSLYHAYHWQKAEKNSSMRALHKCHTIDNIIATTIGSTVIAGIVLTMVVTPYLGATVLAVAGVATATILLLSTVLVIIEILKILFLLHKLLTQPHSQPLKTTLKLPFYLHRLNFYPILNIINKLILKNLLVILKKTKNSCLV